MLEIPDWAYMNSWLTPALLFVLLNIVIGTIAFGPNIGTKKHQEEEQQQQQVRLARASSLLDRLNKSFNLYSNRSEEVKNTSSSSNITTTTFQQQRPPPIEDKEFTDRNPDDDDDDDDDDECDYVEVPDNHHLSRTKSDTKPTSGDVPVKLPQKLKKSASEKSVFRHFVEEEEEEILVEAPRPSTVKENKSESQGDEGVDAKADDFINKFNNQLKLQRVESITRYKNLLNKTR